MVAIGVSATSAASFNASSAASGTSPPSHRESRGCGIPVRFEISVCDIPRSRRRLINSVVSLMAELYALSHRLSMPQRIIRPCIFDGVKPYELFAALMTMEGGSMPLARKMGSVRIQSKLHKFAAGGVANPARATAEVIAKYFKIPVDAIYDEKVATAIAKERNISAIPAGIAAATKKPAQKKRTAQEERAAKLVKDFMAMSPVEQQRLEMLMIVARDGVQPSEKWRAPGRPRRTADSGGFDSGLSDLDDAKPAARKKIKRTED